MAQPHGDVSGNVDPRDYTGCLEPALWAEILRRVPETDRLRHVPLVSRCFSEACQDPHVWPELHVLHSQFSTEARWRSFLRWLAARASGLQTLVFGKKGDFVNMSGWETRTPELVALLAALAPQLRSLEHRYPLKASANPEAALPAELGRLRQLTCLRLDVGMACITTAQVDAMVQTLPSLQHLALQADWCRILSDGFPVSAASSCSLLRHLEIRGGVLGDLPPELGRLTGLTRLDLQSAGVTSLPDSISRLTDLSELALPYNLDLSLPPGLAACRQLTRLDIGSSRLFQLPADLQSLQCLSVRVPPGQQPHQLFWTQLTALTELQLQCEGGLVPAGLGLLTGLSKIGINRVMLNDLPGGPYLSRLESLTMSNCVFLAGVPASLAAATQLRCLSLGALHGGIDLTDADVAVLSSLPALKTLSLKRRHFMSQDLWDARVTQLKAACIGQGRAPPAVATS